MTQYAKPHLTFAQQVDHLVVRGMVCADRSAAEHVLRSLGYYRFSAYAYPFRAVLSDNKPRETSVQFRSDDFTAGTTFDLVAELAVFDRNLRMLCLDALEAIELSLRVQVAYVLGARDPFGHLVESALDAETCSRKSGLGDETHYGQWRTRYSRLQDDARSEDFITHYVEKYDGRLPIWVAIEVLDFGSVVRLFGLMQRSDQNSVARALGIADGKLFARFLKALNYLRNVCAHHARLWNRSLTYQIPTFPSALVPALGHLSDRSPADRKKVYSSLALLAYMTTHSHPQLRWAQRVRELVESFPASSTVSPHGDMGFPHDWNRNDIWMPK